MKALNAIVICLEDKAVLFPYNPNAQFATGQADRQEVARIRPNLGSQRWSRQELQRYIRQKMASHRHIIDPQNANENLLQVLILSDWLIASEVRRLGYPLKEVLGIWEAILPSLNDRAVKQVRHWLRVEFRSGRSRSHLVNQKMFLVENSQSELQTRSPVPVIHLCSVFRTDLSSFSVAFLAGTRAVYATGRLRR